MLRIRSDDLSIRDVRDVQVDLDVGPPAPFALPDEGRLAIAPGGTLLRVSPHPVEGAPAAFAEWNLWP